MRDKPLKQEGCNFDNIIVIAVIVSTVFKTHIGDKAVTNITSMF